MKKLVALAFCAAFGLTSFSAIKTYSFEPPKVNLSVAIHGIESEILIR